MAGDIFRLFAYGYSSAWKRGIQNRDNGGTDMARTGGLLLAAFGLSLAATEAVAANSVSAGMLTVERPTLISAGFDWRISGDDNHNASVTVQYRKKGDVAWKLDAVRIARHERAGSVELGDDVHCGLFAQVAEHPFDISRHR